MSDELKPCSHCGWHRSSIISKTETRASDSGLEITESVFSPFTSDYHEERIPARDFRHGFYVRCNKCGSRAPVAWTPWHVRTEGECDNWCRDHKYWGFDIDSEFAAPAMEEAAAAWNTRAERTCRIEWRGEVYTSKDCIEEDGSYFCTACDQELTGSMAEAWDDYQAWGYKGEKPFHHCPSFGAKVVAE